MARGIEEKQIYLVEAEDVRLGDHVLNVGYVDCDLTKGNEVCETFEDEFGEIRELYHGDMYYIEED